MERRTFIKSSTLAGVGLLTSRMSFGKTVAQPVKKGLRVGIIGLDTSHVLAFSGEFNKENPAPELLGYKVVAAYPQGSKDIQSSVTRVPGYIADIQKLGVEIVDSIPQLLEKTDVILLESNDGRVHLEQAIPVYKAGKTVFIDKPIAGSLTDAIALFQAAKDYKVPMFSSSSMRFFKGLKDIVNHPDMGKVIGAGTFGPSSIEPTHPDYFWYGIHGIELLFAIMGLGCKTVSRVFTPNTDVAVGVWNDNRIGTYRGLREGRATFGGHIFGEKKIETLGGDSGGYFPLLVEIAKFFQSGIPPITAEDTLEVFTFMEAADESKRRGGVAVELAEIRQKALAEVKRIW